MLKNTHKCTCLVCVSKRLLLKLNVAISLFFMVFHGSSSLQETYGSSWKNKYALDYC